MSRVEVTKIINKKEQTLVRYAKPQHPNIDTLRESSDMRDKFVCEVHDAFEQCWRSAFLDMETKKPDKAKKEIFNNKIHELFSAMYGKEFKDGKEVQQYKAKQKAIEIYASYLLGTSLDLNEISFPSLGTKKYFSDDFQEYFKNYIMSIRESYNFLVVNNHKHDANHQMYDTNMRSEANIIRHHNMKSNKDDKDFISIHAIQHMKNYYVRRMIADWVDHDPVPSEDEMVVYYISKDNVWQCFMMECGIQHDVQNGFTFNIDHDQKNNEYIIHSKAFSFPKKYGKNARILAAFDKNVYWYKKEFIKQLKSGGFETAIQWLNENKPTYAENESNGNKNSEFIRTIGKPINRIHNPFLVVLE